MSPNQSNNYIIAVPIPAGNEPVPGGVTPSSASVGFYQSTDLTDESFLNLVNWLSKGVYGSTNIDAIDWLTSQGYWTSYGNQWILAVDNFGYQPAWYSGLTSWPLTNYGPSVGTNDATLISENSIYINNFDSVGYDRSSYLSGLAGTGGTLTLTQGQNQITFGYGSTTFVYASDYGYNLTYFDITDGSGGGHGNTPAIIYQKGSFFNGNDGSVQPDNTQLVRIVYEPNASIFTVGPYDFGAANDSGYGMSNNGTSGFTMTSNDNIGAPFYRLYSPTTSNVISGISTAWTNAGLSTSDSYVFDAFWGAGSTYKKSKVRIGWDGSFNLYMCPIDTRDGSWMNSYGSTDYPPVPSLAGTFNFPATFIPYTPTISDGNYWC